MIINKVDIELHDRHIRACHNQKKQTLIIKWIKENVEWKGEQKDYIEDNKWDHYRCAIDLGKVNNIIALLKSNQALVTKFSSECDEYQEKLDQIDLWVMEIQNLIKKIRGKI